MSVESRGSLPLRIAGLVFVVAVAAIAAVAGVARAATVMAAGTRTGAVKPTCPTS